MYNYKYYLFICREDVTYPSPNYIDKNSSYVCYSYHARWLGYKLIKPYHQHRNKLAECIIECLYSLNVYHIDEKYIDCCYISKNINGVHHCIEIDLIYDDIKKEISLKKKPRKYRDWSLRLFKNSSLCLKIE